MTIMAHTWGDYCTYDDICALPEAPSIGPRHTPVAHSTVYHLVQESIRGLNPNIIIQNETHAISKDGLRYIGGFDIKGKNTDQENLWDHEDFVFQVAVLNSNNCSLPVKVAAGIRIFVCDNGAFMAEHLLSRRHTPNIMGSLYQATHEFGRTVKQEYEDCTQKVTRLISQEVSPHKARSFVIDSAKRGLIPKTHILDVVDEYEKSETFEPGNLWSLHNAFTARWRDVSPFTSPDKSLQLTNHLLEQGA